MISPPVNPPAPPRLSLTLVCLHISAVLYVLVGLGYGVFLAFYAPDMSRAVGIGVGVFCALFSLALAFGVELVVRGLKRRQYWAWITGIIVCGLYLSSCFLPLGALGLWGLLDQATRDALVPAPPQPPRPAGPTNPWDQSA